MKFNVVYLDEVLINKNTKKEYDWEHKDQPGRIISNPTNFNIIFYNLRIA